MYIYKPENSFVPIKVWAEKNSIEAGALIQLDNCSRLPFAFHHIAVMSDVHSGYGVTIGSVLVTDGVIIPNAVGVDIACGVCVIKTSLKVEQTTQEILKKIMGKIREIIPIGVGGKHIKEQDESLMPQKHNFYFSTGGIQKYIVEKEYRNALKSLGSLGSGNHFIEIQKDTDNNIWIMIHSGSRNLGYKVAKYYNELAYDLNIKWHSNTYLPKNKEDSLAFLPIEIQETKDYMLEMQYCVDFALANRKLMMDRIKEQIWRIVTGTNDKYIEFLTSHKSYLEMFPSEMINIAHNYARWENHFGKNVIIHRKGATSARKDEMGIIPGSQGSKSYIVRGLGNKESFESCSHGAGRKMGRKEAKRTLNLEEEIRKLDDQGIIHGIRNVKNLDEAAGAYKDIDEVMRNQADLVEIIVELQPLAVIKGD